MLISIAEEQTTIFNFTTIDVYFIPCISETPQFISLTSPEYAETILNPGATTSGLIRPSKVGPNELKY